MSKHRVRNLLPVIQYIFLVASFLSLIVAEPVLAKQSLIKKAKPRSPHWSHINILDFGRGIKFIGGKAARTKAYDWFSAHVDVAEMKTRVLPEFKSRNPNMKGFVYELDLSACQHKSCDWKGPENIRVANLPEKDFLHFSEDTRLRFLRRNGSDIATIYIPGCPEPEPIRKDSRVQVFVWTDSRWLFNLKSPHFQNWMASRLLGTAGNADGIFLDEHGPGFRRPHAWGFQTKIVSGGGIREYGGKKPLDGKLDEEYNADVATALKKYSSTLRRAGKFLFINTAGYSLKDQSIEQIMAARGVHMENIHRPDRLTRSEYARMIELMRKLMLRGGMADLHGGPCSRGPSNYDKGNFSSPEARYRMWKLANYYILKEPRGSPGIVYFNPNFCIRYKDRKKALNFMNEWLAAYQVDIGNPIGESYRYQSGKSRDGCPYTIFAREYTKSLVLMRPKGKSNCNQYGDITAVSVKLPSSMRMLMDDGLLLLPQDRVRIRNAEAVILIKAEDHSGTVRH